MVQNLILNRIIVTIEIMKPLPGDTSLQYVSQVLFVLLILLFSYTSIHAAVLFQTLFPITTYLYPFL